MVHIRLCSDNCKHNLLLQKLQATNDLILNPVNAVINIICCVKMLQVVPTSNEPIRLMVKILSISKELQYYPMMYVLVYPDATHYLHINIDHLVPHSNQVMTAICLNIGGGHK